MAGLSWEQPLANRGMLAARAVILVAFLDGFIQYPVMAPYAKSLGASPTLVGIIVGAFSATNLVGNLLAGVMVDRWGRKWPIAGGLVLTMLALLGYTLAATPALLLGARVVHGFAAAILTPGAFAVVGDTAQPDRRGRAMGTSGAIIAVAAVLGPPLAGITRDRLGFDAVFLGAAALMLIAAVVHVRFAPSAPVATGRPVRPAAGGRFLAIMTRPGLLAAYAGALAFTVGLGALVTHIPTILEARGEPSSLSGTAFTAYALAALLMMATPANRLSDRYGRVPVVVTGLGLMGVALVVLSVATGTAGVWPGMVVFGLGFGLLFPAVTALVAEATAPNERGTAFGVFYAVYSLGVVIGSALSGAGAERYGDQSGAPFLIGAATALAIAPMVWIAGRRHAPDLRVRATGP